MGMKCLIRPHVCCLTYISRFVAPNQTDGKTLADSQNLVETSKEEGNKQTNITLHLAVPLSLSFSL